MTMPVEFTPESEAALNYERYPHPVPLVQRRLEALWLKSQGLPPGQIAQLVGITENTLRDYFQLYVGSGVEGLKAVAIQGPVSALEAHYESLEAYFRAHPPATLIADCKCVRPEVEEHTWHHILRSYESAWSPQWKKDGFPFQKSPASFGSASRL